MYKADFRFAEFSDGTLDKIRNALDRLDNQIPGADATQADLLIETASRDFVEQFVIEGKVETDYVNV